LAGGSFWFQFRRFVVFSLPGPQQLSGFPFVWRFKLILKVGGIVLRKVNFFALIAFYALTAAAFADQISLKNGDHLTGTVVKSDGKTLVLHTEFAGDITLQFAAITEIKTEQDLHVSTSDKKTVVGPVTTNDGKLEVATKTSGTVEVPEGSVALIRNDAEQAAYEKSLHPGLLHGWNGGANVGFALARGNSKTENLALSMNLVHATVDDKITMSVSSIYTQNDAAIPPSPTTVANLVQASVRYDRNLKPLLFAFVGADFGSNALQALDLRGVYGGGLGFHAIKQDNTTLDLLGGVNYTHETYSNLAATPPTAPPTFVAFGKTNRFAALTLGEEFMHKLHASTVLTESLYFYPDMSDTSQYRGTFGFGTVTKISKWLGWQNQFGDIYVSNPPEGARKNDVVFTTGLNFTFVGTTPGK
jgi:putative salt-induced outer membrane protein